MPPPVWSRSDSAATTGIELQHCEVQGSRTRILDGESTEVVSPESELGGDLKAQDLLSTIDCCVSADHAGG